MAKTKGVIVMVGDSLSTGFNSVADAGDTPLFGELGDPNVLIWDRWLDSSVTEKLGLSSTNAPFGWSRIPYSTSNYTNNGPLPVYFLANALKRALDLEELRVIMMGVPSTDVVQTPLNGNYGTTWYPGLDPNGLFERLSTYYIDEALASGAITTDHKYLGTFASLGANMTNSDPYTVDQTDDLQGNLNALFDAIEGAMLGVSDTSRRVVTRIPLSVRDVVETVELDRLRTVYRELNAWLSESSGGTTYRATALLDDIPFLGANDPHFSAANTLIMGQRLFKAWQSAGQREVLPPVALS